MGDFSSAVRRGLRSLLVFHGRDSPAQFWPFAGVVLGVAFVVASVLFVVVLGIAIAAEPDFVESGTEHAMPGVIPLVVVLAGVALVTACLLAAAVTRRLHDRNHRGGWAGIPLVLVCAGLVMFAFVVKSFVRTPDPDPTLFLMTFANNVVYFISLALLVWQLVGSGSDEENRFGAARNTK